MEIIHKTLCFMHVFMLSCIKHACFHVFSPFSAYFFPHDIIAEKGLLQVFCAGATNDNRINMRSERDNCNS